MIYKPKRSAFSKVGVVLVPILSWMLVTGALGQTLPIERLIADLASVDEDVRQSAVDELVDIGAPAVEPVIAALRTPGDENGQLRLSSAAVLINIEDVRAVEPLITALNDEHWQIRQFAALGLGRFGDPRAIESLIAASGDKSRDVRSRAVQALGAIGGPLVVETLIGGLRDRYRFVADSATDALVAVGTPAVDALIGLLTDDSRDIRKRAATALGDIGDSRAVESLVAAINNDDMGIDLEAIKSLGQISSPVAVEYLVVRAASGSQFDRRAAINSLGQSDGPQVIDVLSGYASGGDFRRIAVEALGEVALRDPRAIPPLLVMAGDREYGVSRDAIRVLDKVPPASFDSATANALEVAREELRLDEEALAKGTIVCCGAEGGWCSAPGSSREGPRLRPNRQKTTGIRLVGKKCYCPSGHFYGTMRLFKSGVCQ